MPFKPGDKVLIERQEPRTSAQVVFTKCRGIVIEAFNACDDDGDHWQYRIRGERGEYIVWHEGKDAGSLAALAK